MKTFKQYFLTEGKIKPDATKFEGDLIGAMMHISAGGQDTPRGNRDTGSSNIEWDPDKNKINPDHEDYDEKVHNTYKLAAGIAEKMHKNGINISKPGRVSGDSDIKLSKLYLDMGVTKKESKTDITYGEMYVSVKAHSAQILSSQANETAAIIQSVVKYDIPKEAKALAKTSADILQKAFSREVFDKIVGVRDHIQLIAYLKQYGIDKVMADHKKKTRKTMPYSQAKELLWAAAGRREAAKMKKTLKDMKDTNIANQKLMTSFMGFDPKKPSKEQEDLFQGMSDALGVTSEVQQEVANFLKMPEVRQAIISEAATGKHKFDTKSAIATHVLAWNDDPDNPKYHHADIQDFVTQAEPSLKISITTRGTGDSDCLKKALDDNDGDLKLALRHCTRGGSMRATINTLFDSADLTHYELEPLEQDDYQYLEEQWKEVEEVGTRVLLENWEKTQHLLLQEGILDSLKKGYEVVKAGAKKIMAKLKRFFMAIGQYLMKWLRNTGAYMKAFGMKPKVTGPKWKPSLK